MGTDQMQKELEGLGDYKYGFSDPEVAIYKSKKGFTREIVEEISYQKGEPDWMRKIRLKAYEHAIKRPTPTWGGDLSGLNLEDMYYYVRPSEKTGASWDEVPDTIKNTFDKLGIPEAERKFLAGVGAQYESEMVYHSIRENLEKQGVIFLSSDDGLKQYPDIYKQYFGTVVPYTDNKFAAINTATWSGGSFVYVPKGVHVEMPLQAYFRINAENMGQFERTLIIADEDSSVHYIEGCTAPTYSSDSLHSAVVELVALDRARIRYTTIQNWSTNVYNLVTKRAHAHTDAVVEWVDGNLGSKLTMKYPAIVLKGERAHGEVLSIAFAGHGQHQDAGAKMTHAAPNTTSRIVSKSISKDDGRSSYRGLVRVNRGATGCKTSVECDALLIGENAVSDTYPTMDVAEADVRVEHEARVSKVGEEQLFYLQSRGLDADKARLMIVNGFIEPFVKELPMEYAVELNRLIELEMEGSVG